MSNATGDSKPKLDFIRAPSPSSRVGIKDPGFNELTAAEKLNDSEYRKLIYDTYPNEWTCACPPADSSKPKNRFECRSGCKNNCCSRMRKSGGADQNCPKYGPNSPNHNQESEEKKSANVKNIKNQDGSYCCRDRLRGGGEGTNVELSHPRTSGPFVRNPRNSWNIKKEPGHFRLGGGVDFQNDLYRNLTPEGACAYDGSQSTNFGARNLYRTGNDTLTSNINIEGSNAPAGCCCPGKEMLTPGSQKSMPIGDSLVKAFQETQQFVDSLGRVPGLSGLGLMDPSESPYFGRTMKREPEVGEAKIGMRSYDLPNPQCTGPCNAKMLRSEAPAIGATPFTIAVPGRGGIIREAIPIPPGPGLTFAEPKFQKSYEKSADIEQNEEPPAESGPCGELGCGSRKRKPEVPEVPVPVVEEETPKTDPTAKNGRRTSRSGYRTKRLSKIRKGRASPKRDADQAGRRSTGRRRSSGRRMISFVYSAGDVYGGEALSHKKCVEPRRRIPWNMGWLWHPQQQLGRLKPRRGWRPGAIGRRMIELLAEAQARSYKKRRDLSKASKSSSSRSGSAPSSRGKPGRFGTDRAMMKRKQRAAADKEEREPPPTLHIHRKDGTYYVTMYPIKQEEMDVPKLEEPMKPLQFKIAKNRDDSDGSSSTASDMEIEFSPPAAVNRYRKKPNVIHIETQVKQHDILEAFKSNGGVQIKSRKKIKSGKK